jgi:hypothetical protein
MTKTTTIRPGLGIYDGHVIDGPVAPQEPSMHLASLPSGNFRVGAPSRRDEVPAWS